MPVRARDNPQPSPSFFLKMGAVQRPDVGGLRDNDRGDGFKAFLLVIFLWLKIWSIPRVSDVYSVESIPNGLTEPGFDGIECS